MTGADVDREGRIGLHHAAMEDDAELIDRLVEDGADVDHHDRRGYTPLHMAAEYHAVAAARRLLAHGASVHATDVHGNTPLWTATFNSKGRGELIELLFEHGADPDRRNDHDETPRGLAELIGNYDVAQFFERR